MKEQKWDDSYEGAKDFLDTGAIAIEEEDEEDEEEDEAEEQLEEEREAAPKAKTRFTELRRRIEERLDSKRIDLEFDFDDLDEPEQQFENLQ